MVTWTRVFFFSLVCLLSRLAFFFVKFKISPFFSKRPFQIGHLTAAKWYRKPMKISCDRDGATSGARGRYCPVRNRICLIDRWSHMNARMKRHRPPPKKILKNYLFADQRCACGLCYKYLQAHTVCSPPPIFFFLITIPQNIQMVYS